MSKKKEEKKKEKKGSSSSSSSSSSDEGHKHDKHGHDKHGHKHGHKRGGGKGPKRKVVLRREDFSHLKHDPGKLGGKGYSKKAGLYGGQQGAGGTAGEEAHIPMGVSQVANAYTAFPAEIQARVDVLIAEEDKLEEAANAPVVASSLAGKKKALLIGINYAGTPNALKGCINDVKNVQAFITENFHFPADAEHMRILTDEQADAALKPTRANILAGFEWLKEGAASGDSLFFHYSGHGATVIDKGPVFDEPTGMDETLVPIDFQTAGMITDDEIHEILITPLPAGVRLTAITDCCHSGSILDLPYTYVLQAAETASAPVLVDQRKVQMAAALAQNMQFGEAEASADVKTALDAPGTLQTGTVKAEAMQIRTSSADVVHISGCRDDQTSADAFIAGANVGAMSHALITAFKEGGPTQTFGQLLVAMRAVLKSKAYKQIPMLSTGYRGQILDQPLKM